MKKGLTMSLADVEAHQRKHGFTVGLYEPNQPEVVKRRDRMNKTEAAFARRLEAMQAHGDIVSFTFEAITLRLADDCRYTPDFFVIVSSDPLRLRFYEVKGGHIWDDAKVKFKVARENITWAEWEMWQNKGGEWSQR